MSTVATTYLKLLLRFLVPLFIITFAVLILQGKNLLPQSDLWPAILIFYPVVWLMDRTGIKNGIWLFDKEKTTKLWIGGIPIEDHLAIIFMTILVYYLLRVFKQT